MDEKIKQNLIPLAILVAGILIAGVIFLANKDKITLGSKFLSPNVVGERAVKFIKDNFLEGGEISLSKVEEESGLYKVKFKVSDNEYESFASKDGKWLFFQGFDMTNVSQTKKEVPKTEKPDVKLFVMSYCPYGLQMEKAILPVWELLQGKADIGIYFVDYIMHGKEEMEENLRQYCIQKEEKEKYISYLNCFVQEGKYEDCLTKAKIDKEKINSCEKSTDAEFKISESFSQEGTPPFNVHQELNEKYKVRGSPTLVINETVVNPERSPEKVKQAICDAFLNPPSECEKTLSTATVSPGFGLGEGTSSGGTCQ